MFVKERKWISRYLFLGEKSFELNIYIENGNLFHNFCFYWIWCEQTSIRQPIYGRIKGNKLPIYFQCKLSQAHCYAEGMSFHRKRTDFTAKKKITYVICSAAAECNRKFGCELLVKSRLQWLRVVFASNAATTAAAAAYSIQLKSVWLNRIRCDVHCERDLWMNIDHIHNNCLLQLQLPFIWTWSKSYMLLKSQSEHSQIVNIPEELIFLFFFFVLFFSVHFMKCG